MSKEKEKFFCMYHAQDIMKCTTPSGYSELMKVDFVAAKNQAFFLELTPLSHISDEDAIKVFNHVFPKCLEEVPNEERIETVKYEIPQESFSIYKFLGLEDSTRYIDKVRELGYALPWMGISVEEQIKRGWVKLKIENNE